MDEKNNVAKSHKVLLINRKSGAFSGVVDVLSFDVAEILLETELGMLLIKGHDLHVNRLSLEKGETPCVICPRSSCSGFPMPR